MNRKHSDPSPATPSRAQDERQGEGTAREGVAATSGHECIWRNRYEAALVENRALAKVNESLSREVMRLRKERG